jgi:hypothetical protein
VCVCVGGGGVCVLLNNWTEDSALPQSCYVHNPTMSDMRPTPDVVEHLQHAIPNEEACKQDIEKAMGEGGCHTALWPTARQCQNCVVLMLACTR